MPSSSNKSYSELQQRLIPHANYVRQRDCPGDNFPVYRAFQWLRVLYFNQGKLKESGEIFERALAGKENALGPDHTSTLQTVHNLGSLYSEQSKLKKAEEMYERALAWCILLR
jgi:tetratricopeptide (TPR) repeat protein